MIGNAYYEKKGKRWYIQFYWQGKKYAIYKDPKTNEKFFVEEMALQCLGAIREEIKNGSFNPKHWKKSNPLLIKTYTYDWLDKIKLSPNTIRGHKAAIDKYIIPFLGEMDIRHIRYNHILDFVYWIVGVGDKLKCTPLSRQK